MIEVKESTAPTVEGKRPEGKAHGSRSGAPSFPELVYAHFAWWRAVRRSEAVESANAPYRETLERFQARHGEIVESYWCTHVESAVALTEKKRKKRTFRWASSEITFHRASDWATKSYPDIAAELHRCDELAVRAKSVLSGVRQRICLQLVMTSAAHLLSLVDARAAQSDDTKTESALGREHELLDNTSAYYAEAANGQAQIIYFAGMAAIAAIVSIICGVWLAFEWDRPMAAIVGGSIGAVVSVIQRINSGHFDLQYDVGRPYAFFLGGLRPLIGAAFALAISFAFGSGILQLPRSANDPDKIRMALLVIAFLAGFSERWAQDTLATAVPNVPVETVTSQQGAPPSLLTTK